VGPRYGRQRTAGGDRGSEHTASFVYPGAGYPLFILIPQCFMIMEPRPAYVAGLMLVVVNAGAGLVDRGANSANVRSVIAFAVFSFVFALLLGGYLSRIIDQSKQRALLIEELERTRAELAR
jgi:type III secretory pathway component EscT